MIIKIIRKPPKQGNGRIRARGFAALLHYHDRHESELCHTENIIGNTPVELAQYFMDVSTRSSSRVKDPVFHAVVSFAYNEVDPAPEVIETMARQYLQKMGYANQPWAMYRHTDKQHIHYHIISSRVDVRSGKAISSSYEGLRTKTVLEQLAPLFGYQVGKGADKRQQQNQGLIREIYQVVQKVLLEDQPYSMYRFCQACEKRGLKVKKLPRGYVISQGNSYPVALSKLPVFAERRLSHILRAVKQERIREMRYIRKCLYLVLRNMPQIDMQSDMAAELFGDKLLNQLAQYNINVIYNRNSVGIVGISFGRPDLTFKGSELKLSWETILHYVQSKRGASAKKKPILQTTVRPQEAHLQTLVQGAAVGKRIAEDEEEKKRRGQVEQEI